MFKNLFPDLSIRSQEKELMDLPECDPHLLNRTLLQFRWMNLLVSRYRSLLRRFVLSDMLKDPSRSYRFLDIGCGAADIPVWLMDQCHKRGLKLKITCIDADRRVVNLAREIHGNLANLQIIHESIFSIEKLTGPFDYVFANHLLHHIPENELVSAVQKINDYTKRFFIISDIYRSPVSYFGFSLLVPLFFHRSFIYRDGLQSIKRGFKLKEFKSLVEESKLSGKIKIGKMFPGRIYLVGTNKTAMTEG